MFSGGVDGIVWRQGWGPSSFRGCRSAASVTISRFAASVSHNSSISCAVLSLCEAGPTVCKTFKMVSVSPNGYRHMSEPNMKARNFVEAPHSLLSRRCSSQAGTPGTRLGRAPHAARRLSAAHGAESGAARRRRGGDAAVVLMFVKPLLAHGGGEISRVCGMPSGRPWLASWGWFWCSEPSSLFKCTPL